MTTQEVKPSVPQSTEALISDYHAKSMANERQYETGIQVVGALVTLGLVVAGFISANPHITFPAQVYWLAPAVLASLYSLILQIFYRTLFVSYYILDLEDEIARRIQADGINFFHLEAAITRALYRPKTASVSFLLTYVLMFFASLFFYIFLLVYSSSHFHNTLQLVLYSLFQLAVFSVLFAMCSYYMLGLERIYEKWIFTPFRASERVNSDPRIRADEPYDYNWLWRSIQNTRELVVWVADHAGDKHDMLLSADVNSNTLLLPPDEITVTTHPERTAIFPHCVRFLELVLGRPLRGRTTGGTEMEQ